MVFGDRTFGRRLGLDEVMRKGPHDEISVPVRRDTSKLPLSAILGAEKRWLSTNQEESSYWNLTRVAP